MLAGEDCGSLDGDPTGQQHGIARPRASGSDQSLPRDLTGHAADEYRAVKANSDFGVPTNKGDAVAGSGVPEVAQKSECLIHRNPLRKQCRYHQPSRLGPHHR